MTFDDFDHDQRMRSLTPRRRSSTPAIFPNNYRPDLAERLARLEHLERLERSGQFNRFMAQPPPGHTTDMVAVDDNRAPPLHPFPSPAFAPAPRVDTAINGTHAPPAHMHRNGHPGFSHHGGPLISPRTVAAPYRHNGPPTPRPFPAPLHAHRDRDRDYGAPRRAPPPPAGSQVKAEPNKVLGVFGLSIRTRERDLEDEFMRYGDVEKVVIVYDQRVSPVRWVPGYD